MLSRSRFKPFVEVLRKAETVTDRFGNEVPGAGEWVKTPVFSWAVRSSEEVHGDSILRLIEQLVVYCAPDVAPAEDSSIRLPDGSVWLVEGRHTDFNHGPWWSPNLVTVTAKKVEG